MDRYLMLFCVIGKVSFSLARDLQTLNQIDKQQYYSIDGIVFMYAVDDEDSIKLIKEQINQFNQLLRPQLKLDNKKLSAVVVANKIDLVKAKEGEQTNTQLQQDVCSWVGKQGLKHFAISCRCCMREEIEDLFVEMINQNEINRYVRMGVNKSRSWIWCLGDDNVCDIY